MLTTVAEPTIKLCAGLIVMGAAVLLWRSVSAPPPRPLPGAPLAAGFAGGFLGAATSLNGIAPVLLLARDKAAPRSFLADLAVYFVASNAIGLLILLAHERDRGGGALPRRSRCGCRPRSPATGSARWSVRACPKAAFRRITLAIVFLAGAVTAFAA